MDSTGRTVGIGNRAVDHDGGHTVTGGGEIVFVNGGQARVVIGQHGGIVDGIDGDGCGVAGRGKGGGGSRIRVGAGTTCALIPGFKGKCGRAVVIGCGHETQLLGVDAGQGAVEQQGVIDGQQAVVDGGPGGAVVGGVLPGAVGIVDGGDGNGLDGRPSASVIEPSTTMAATLSPAEVRLSSSMAVRLGLSSASTGASLMALMVMDAVSLAVEKAVVAAESA